MLADPLLLQDRVECQNVRLYLLPEDATWFSLIPGYYIRKKKTNTEHKVRTIMLVNSASSHPTVGLLMLPECSNINIVNTNL